MDVQKITVDRKEARELYQKYKAHVHYSQPIDREIQRTYQLIAQGRVVIRALESIKAAGLYEDGPNKGLPKLAIARATANECYFHANENGAAVFNTTNEWGTDHWVRRKITFPAGSFPTIKERSRWHAAKAQLPIVPVHLRPKRGIANYHVLWEAEWTRIPPRDPLLLRRIGKGDMWLVVAAWDLTEVERAALATRLNG